MDSEVVANGSGCVRGNVYDANPADVANSVLSVSLDHFTTFEDAQGTLIYVPNSSSDGETTLGFDELPEEANNFKTATNEPNQEPSSDVYLSTGIYIHPLTLNGGYQNIMELIDIDSDELLEEASPKKKEEPNEPNTVVRKISTGGYDFTFGSQGSNNNNFPYFQSYPNVPINGEVQCLNLIYNPASTAENCAPEFIDINQLMSGEMNHTVSSFLNIKGEPTSNPPELPKEKKNEAKDGRGSDDDVIFVNEWLPLSSNQLNLGTVRSLPPIETTKDSANTEVAIVPETAIPSGVKRRRRRRTFGEKRKNPVRKAQIDKASLELIEKLTIPPSVFNARVKERKARQKVNIETKNVRQSCRTSGAILSPPRSLTKNDFKEWPVDGMHERPVYNEETDTIIKYHVPTTKTGRKRKEVNEKQVLSELNSLQDNSSRNQPSTNAAKPKENKRTYKKQTGVNKQKSQQLAGKALDRFKLMLGYVEELKAFNQMVTANSDQENVCAKPTVYEKSQEFHRQKGKKEPRLATKLRGMVGTSQKKNVQQMVPILQDTCTLYSLTSGVKDKELINLIKSFDSTHKTTFG